MFQWLLSRSPFRKGLNAESGSIRLPANTTDCQQLALDYQALLGRLSAYEGLIKLIKKNIEDFK